jgi:hypothetical protein
VAAGFGLAAGGGVGRRRGGCLRLCHSSQVINDATASINSSHGHHSQQVPGTNGTRLTGQTVGVGVGAGVKVAVGTGVKVAVGMGVAVGVGSGVAVCCALV